MFGVNYFFRPATIIFPDRVDSSLLFTERAGACRKAVIRAAAYDLVQLANPKRDNQHIFLELLGFEFAGCCRILRASLRVPWMSPSGRSSKMRNGPVAACVITCLTAEET